MCLWLYENSLKKKDKKKATTVTYISVVLMRRSSKTKNFVLQFSALFLHELTKRQKKLNNNKKQQKKKKDGLVRKWFIFLALLVDYFACYMYQNIKICFNTATCAFKSRTNEKKIIENRNQ